MAKGNITAAVVTPAIVHLDLSYDEANTLVDILNRVGGCPDKSRRKYAEGLRDGLRDADIKGLDLDDIQNTGHGGIYFKAEGETS